MGSLAFPVPVYTTLTSSPAPFTTTKRALSTTSPGTTDNTATGCNGGVSGVHGFFRPAANITMTTGSGTTPPDPVTIDDMWILPINPTLAASPNGVKIDGGTWTIPIHYSRPGGVLTADVPGTLWAILVQVDQAATGLVSEIGRSAANNVTATTTEQSVSASITGVATEFVSNENLGLLIYFDRAGALTSDTFRIHTNSTTALRITAAPTYARVLPTVGSASGSGQTSGIPSLTQQTVGSASGSGVASGTIATVMGTVGSASGAGIASGQISRVQPVTGSASGYGVAVGIVAQLQGTVGYAAGDSLVDGALANIQAVVGSASGLGQAVAAGGSVIGTVGSASGVASANGKAAIVIGTVGTVDIGGGGTTTIVRPVFAGGE